MVNKTYLILSYLGPAAPVVPGARQRNPRPAVLRPPTPAPNPDHQWPAEDQLTPFELLSHKRARGKLCNKSGAAIRELIQDSVPSKDNLQVWSRTPRPGAPDIVNPDPLPEAGHPNPEAIQDLLIPEDYFYALIDDQIFELILLHTNAIRSEVPNVVPAHPFYGGRWLGNSRQSCDICMRSGNLTTKDICESQRCGNKPVCKWHSFILCQRCFYNLH